MKGVEALLTVTLGPERIPLARGVRAGGWVFASGVMATDARGGPAPEMMNGPRPLSGLPKRYREASRMFRCAQEVLRAGGTDFPHAVRTDQYFPDWRAVPFFHQARRECCGNYIAPSTSILEPQLRLTQAGMSMEVIAVRPDSGMQVTPVYPPGLDVPSTSSFVPVVKAGGHVFVAGFLAAWKPGDLGGIAPEAKVPEGHLWKGNRIQLEADYIIRNKLMPALDAAGASLNSAVKAQVYLADIHDVPAFNQVWARHFGEHIPATAFVPALDPGFAIAEARCEINLLALASGGPVKKMRSRPASPAVCDGHPVAVKAGDLLCFSGLVASDEGGRVKAGRRKSSSGIAAQMEYLLDVAEKTCAEFGTSLENVLRIQQFHTDLEEFYPACRAWKRRLHGRPLPISTLQVPGPLLVPGCTVELDLWVYAP
ncbi:MAG: RidA family protein [Candidatus Omnitrophica bacterium]|nr:RidA family protein [Candidatus Omnitrophota bacterium]